MPSTNEKSKTSEGRKSQSSPKRSTAPFVSSEKKKLSSLSSFQPTLNFKSIPTSTSAPSRLSTATNGSVKSKGKEKVGDSDRNGTSGKRRRSDEGEDTKLMPPPPQGIQTKSKARGDSPALPSSTTAKGNVASSSSRIGQNGEEERKGVIDFTEEDDDAAYHAGPSRHHGMWTEEYAPNSESDLVCSKARISTVKKWLIEALGMSSDIENTLSRTAMDKIRKYRRILALKGPAGAGKTTTIRVLAKEMGIDVLEWGEGADEWSLGGGGMDRESSLSKLTSFLARNSYQPLNLASRSKPSNPKPRLLLLTSLPNISHQQTKDTFHAALKDFCHSFSTSACPLVIIHSESGSSGAAEESWREREKGSRDGISEVLGKDVKGSPYCQEVEFLPVAPTFQIKALKRIIDLSCKKSSNTPPPPSALQLIALTSNGDLRSAVNSLQMLCTQTAIIAKKRKGNKDDDGTNKKRKTSASSTGRGGRGGKGAKVDISDDLRAVLDALTRREQSLHLFHALGKVLYNKRLGDPSQDNEDQELLSAIQSLPPDDTLPQHLEDFSRRKSLVQTETFATTIPVDASSFSLWLHQSIPSFCSSIDELSAALDELGGADILRTDDDLWHSNTQAISYALNLSIRGIQISLPSPVPRNHQKILKPQFFSSIKSQKDNEHHVDLVTAYLVKKGVNSSTILSEFNLNVPNEDGDENGGNGVWGGINERKVMASEIIPMLIKMQGLTQKPILPSSAIALKMPPYGIMINQRMDELTASQDIDSEMEVDEEEKTESDVHMQGWDMVEDEVKVEDEKGWLEDDQIEDFD